MTSDTGPRLTIDLDALAKNYASMRAQSRSAETAAVVKADGYGLGAGPVARRLWTEGASTFFVARLSEGQDLRRELGPREAVIFVLDGLLADTSAYRDAGLVPVINTSQQARQWLSEDAPGGVLQIDTGMNRLGVSPGEAEDLAREGLSPDLIMSHLACASDPHHPMNAAQLAAFRQARAFYPNARASLCNSAGVLLGSDYHFDMVRPGIALYGGAPFSEGSPRALSPVATLTAPVLQIRDLNIGESVGYGADWVAMRRSRIAVIGAGYADGLLRSAAAGGYRLGGDLPVIGRISMDMLALDVTDTPDTSVGDRIELFGAQTSINDLAAAAGTIAYELLTRVSSRAERTYIGAL